MESLHADAYLIINQFLAIMGGLFLCVGLLLLIIPGTTLKIIRFLNVWIDTDRWLNYLNSELKSEAFIYRHHRFFGIFILLASIWIFWIFVISYTVEDFQVEAISNLSPVINDWLIHSVIFLIRFLSVGFIFLGLIIFLRPSLLKAMERPMNRWINTDVATSLDVPHREADEYLVRHPRLVGSFVFCAGLYLVLSAALMLFY